MKNLIASRRAQLLARSALCGVLAAMAIGASPAMAQVTGVGTITSTDSNGALPGVASGGGVTDITLGASRSIVNWADLTVTPTEALNFYFNNRSDIVVNRVAGAASIDGVLNGCISTCATNGGNIWILSTGGVLIGANARIDTGGFLASTGSLTDSDILDGDMNFAFTGAPAGSTISVANGASLNTSGGSLALIAPIVTTAAGSTITATNGSDVVYGSAENYNVTFAPTGADDLDLITFEVPSRADGSGGTPGLTLNGTTNANQVFAAIVSKSGVAASILLGGDITATTASGENGDIVLSAGSGFIDGIPLNPGGGFEGGITQNAGSTLTGANVTMRAADAIVAGPINATGQVWLDSAWAGISQTGAITASNLRVESGAGIDLTDAGNDFDTISFLDNNGSGPVSLTDADGFHITGGVNNWVTAGTVNLTALNGSITQSGLGVIWAGTLNASATGDIALGNLTNHLTTLGTLTAGGAVSYRGGSNFNLDGAVTAASLTLRSDTGAIAQTGAPLNVGQLSVQAETGINLNRVTNQVDEITGLSTTSGDIILISNGDLSLAGNVVGSGLVSFHTFNGAITQNSGVITANAFQAIADAGLDLGGANQVAQLGRLSAGGTGDIIFRNAGALVLTDDITAAGDDVTLYSTSGGITQNSGAITANRLTVSAAGTIQLNTATNNAATIGGLASTGGSILYRSANSFDIQGDITTGSSTGVVLRTVGAGASITQVSGTVDVGWFGANANGSIILNGANNQIRRLVATSSGAGDVSIHTTTDLAMGQPVTAGQALSLTSGGRIYQDSTGFVVANTLNLSAVTGISLPNAAQPFVNSVQNLGTITNATSGGIVIANYSGSNTGLTGNITAAGQSVSITDVAGGLNQTGGTIMAGTLSASGTGHVALTNSNAVDSLGGLTSSGGNVSFRNVGDVNVNGSIASVAGGAVTLRSNTGAINLNGGPITSGWISLDAGTTISQAAGATLTANALSLTSGGDVSLGEANDFDVINDLHVGGDLTLRNLGSINLGPVVSGGYTSGGALTLTSDTGSISSTTSGIVTSRLTASASGSINLDGTIASLGAVTAGSTVLLQNYSGVMDLTGDVTGSTVSLYSDGGVNQSGGKIDTGRLNVIGSGAISLTGANEIDVIGRLETDQLSSGTGADITLRNVGDIVLDYLVGAVGGTVTLTSDTGVITQTGFSAITADRLIASAAGNITLYDGVNNVATIGGFSSTNGDIVYRDVDGFDLQGDITANSSIFRGAMLVAGGAGGITQTSGVLDVGYFRGIAQSGITLGGANLIRRLISTQVGNGALTLNTTTDLSVDGTVSANSVSLSSTGAITQAANAQIWANALSASAVTGINLTASGFGANNISNLGLITNTTSGGVVISNATNMNLAGSVMAAGQAVSISNTLGGITQAGGIIVADTLSLSATGGISATRNNVIGNLGAVTAGGNVAITNVGALNLTDTVNTGGGNLTLTSNTGQVQQTGGVVTANVVNLQAAGRIWLNNANAVINFGTVTASGHVLLRNDSALVVGGDITANGFDVTLRSNTGSITQTAGSDITSRYLQVIAATGVTLTNLGNAVDEIAWAQTNSGGFAFSQTNGFQISGPVMAGGQTASLTSLNGAITQTSGTLSAGTLNASAAGTLALTQANNVDNLGVISTGGNFLFLDVTGFHLTDDVTAANQVVMLAQGGSIIQSGGIITAADINVTATDDILLGGANQINSISYLSAGQNLLYRQVGDLSVPTISAAGTVSLYSITGDITQTGTITADTLALGAGGDITLGENFVSRLGRIDAGGSFTAVQGLGLSSGALELTDDITVGGTMVLLNHGDITQTGGAIAAANLFLDTDGILTATGANSISGYTSLTAQDATFNAAGDLNIRVNTPGSATITSTGAVVIDGGGASTGDTLNIQAANGISQGAQTLTFTNFGNLTNTTSGGINLTNSAWLNLNGAISAVGQGVTLNVANGGIIQSSGSNINARRLSVTTTQGALLGEMNQVAELGDVNTGAHNFLFRTLGDLLIDGDITSALNVNLTSATGSISQTAGSDIMAGGLTVWAETGINLTNAGNNATRILGLFNLGSGGIAYGQTNGILIDGTIRAWNQTVSLTSLAGGISETGNIFFPQIEAGTLNLSAGGAITLHRDNDVDNLGVVSAGAGFTFNDVDGFNLTGSLTGGAVVLDALNGSITQTGGVINAASIDAAASGNLDLGSANVVGAVTALSAGGDILYRQVGDLSVPAISANGSLSLYSTTGSITQTGALSAARFNAGAATGIALTDIGNAFGALGNLTNTISGGISVYEADDINLTGAISTGAAQSVTLAAFAGAITQQTGATVEAGALTLSASAGATLDGDNDVDALGTITVGPSFSFTDVDGFDIAGDLYAATANLTSGGAITQSTGVLGVGTLSLTATSVMLNGANDTDTLGAVDVTGNLTLRDIDGIGLSGVVVVDGTLNLISDSEGVTQLAGGAIDVGRLEASALWGIELNRSGNAIDSLGDITSTNGNIAIVNDTAFGALEIDGDVSAAGSGRTVYINSLGSGVTMTAGGSITSAASMDVRGSGNIVLGDIDAGGVLTIVAAGGSVSSTAAPTIAAARLTGSATTGDFILTGANIDIDEIGYIEVGNTFSITGNNGPLDLSNNIIAQTVALGTTGAMTQIGGSLDAATGSFSAGGVLTLAANNGVDTVSLNGASITYTSAGSFAANVVTSTGAVSLISNTGKITQTALSGRIVADSLTASAATGLEFYGGQNDIRVLAGLGSTSGGVTWRDMGGFEITGNIDATGQTVELVSDGTGADGNDVVQTSGVITANRLQGTSAGDLLFNNANVVGQLGYLNGGGDIRYRGAASFTLQDNVNTGGGLILNSDTGSIQQFGGAIVVGAFSGTAAQGISLSRVNDVDALGAVDSGSGDFNFRDIDSLDIAGLITSDNGILLQAGGDITQSSGSIVTGTLNLFANGSALVNGSGNDIDFLGLSTGMNALTFADVDGFGISDRVFSTGTIILTATTGDIATTAGGYLSAQGLNVYAASGEIDLAGDNLIENVGDLTAGGDVTFHEIDGFTLSGTVSAGDALTLSVDDGGILQNAGSVTAGSLSITAPDGITLGSASNDVDTIVGMNTDAGGIFFRDADSLNLAGAVTAVGQSVNLYSGGDLTQSATGVITATVVQGSAVGAFALGDALNNIGNTGGITADRIAIATSGTLNIISNMTAVNGVELKADTGILQATGTVMMGASLRAHANGSIFLGQANDFDSIGQLYSDLGDITYADVNGFSLDGGSLGDFWTSGTFTLSAGGTGSIAQSGAGLRAGLLLANAGGNVTLDLDNRIDVLGDSSAGGSVFQVVNLGDLEVAGDISVAGALGGLDLTSQTGKVEQTSGELDAYTVGGASAGDFILTDFTGALGDITTTAGDIDVTNAGDIFLFGTLQTDNADSVTLTSTAGSIGQGAGRIETGTLNLDAAIAIALDGAQANDVERLGTVSTYSNFTFRNDDSFQLTGDIDVSMIGGMVGLTADSGAITQTGGVITAYALNLTAMTGLDLSGANMVDRLTIANGSTGDVDFVNAKALNVLGVTSSGGIDLETTAGVLTVSGGIATDGFVRLAGADGVLATGTLNSLNDVTVTAATGDIELYDAVVGDDLAVTAIDGDAQVRNLTLTGSSDGEADGGNAYIYASHDAFLGARDEAGIVSQSLNRAGGAGGVVVASTGDGAAGVFLQNANAQIHLSAGPDGTATYVLDSGDLWAGDVSGTNVVLKANAGMVNADLVILGGGDYTLYGRDFSVGAFGFIGAARDITVTDTFGPLELTANLLADRNLTITAVGSVLDGTGATSLLAGLDGTGTGVLTVTATDITLAGAGADGDVSLTATSGNVNVGIVAVSGDYTLSGAGFSVGALSPIGATAGTWSITDTGGFDFTGLTLTYNGDIDIQADDAITGGDVQSITGSVTINGPDDIDIEGLYAGTGVTVTASNLLTVDTIDAYDGDISLTGTSVTVEGYAEAGGQVLVTATNGTADVNSATAGGAITVQSTSGDAILGAAALNGVTGDLTVRAIGGDVIFGVLDYSTVSTDNIFGRAAGNTGTATLISSTGDVTVNLWESARLDLIQAAIDAEVSTETGDLEIGQIQSTGGEISAETIDGSLTIGTATATSGLVGLYSAGGDLTITGSVHGGAGVDVQTDGLLDGSLASQIVSGGDLQLVGGEVLLDRVKADGAVVIGALNGDAYLEFAEAGAGLGVISAGDATVRGAEVQDGINIQADGDIIFGADTRALITGDNYGRVNAGGGCGCGGDIYLTSLNGNATVNLNSVAGTFDTIASGPNGDVNIAINTGNLTIYELAGYNITADVSGSIETLVGAFSGGGNYSLTASDFLGNVLNPDRVFGTMGDYTVVDTYGGLDMTGVSVDVDGDILIQVLGSGSLTGDAQLTAGGDLSIAASTINADTVEAVGDLTLHAGVYNINVATMVEVGGDYTLTGANFSAAALSPLGARAGDLRITDTGGDFDYTALSYGGDIIISAASGTTIGGAITSAGGDIQIQADSIAVGALSAVNGQIDAYAYGGSGANVASATALDDITIYTSNGNAVLGAATLLGTGANSLLVNAGGSSGNATLGSSTPGGIAGANTFTSNGSTTTANVQAAGGAAYVNLDTSGDITAVTALGGDIGIAVRSGDFSLGSAWSTGQVDIAGPDGRLTVGSLTADGDVDIRGADITLTDVDTSSNLFVTASGDVTFGGPGGVRSGRIAVDNWIVLEADDVTQSADAGFSAIRLVVDAADISLLGLNQVQTVGDVTGDSFAYRSVRTGGFDILGNIDVGGGTVGLIAESGGITQGVGYSIVAGSLTGSSQGGAGFAGDNYIDALGDFDNTGGAFFLNVPQALNIVGTVNSDSALAIQTRSGGMTIASTGTVSSTASGDAVILASDGVLTNNSGADAVQAVNGRWLIYTQASGDPNGSTAGDNYGGLGGRSYYGVGYDFAGDFTGPINAGNRFVHAYQPTLTVTPNSQTVTYDGGIPTLTALITGLVNGDLAADAWSGSPLISGATSKNAGTYGLSAAPGSLLSDMNYGFSFGSGTLVIDPKALTGILTANSRTYDGTTAATGSIGLDGVVAGDAVVGTATGLHFADRNAGLGKTVTASGAGLSGADAGNYTLGSVGTAVADILRRSLTGVLTADNKTYDGTTAATGSIGLTGVVAGDAVAASGTFNFADKNAGAGKIVTASDLLLSGADAGNYDLGPISGAADILRLAIGGAVVANNKTYDGSTAATGSISLTGVVAGDDIGAGGTLTFDSRNAGVGRTVTAADASLSGTDAGNYTLTNIGSGTADILQRAISVTANNQSKRFGQSDPFLSYVIGGSGLAQGDVLSGGLVRVAGESSGVYAIQQGDLAASSNYVLTFRPGEFVIRIPPAGGIQSLQRLRALGEGPAFALDRDPSPDLISTDDQEEPEPEHRPSH